MHRDQFGYVVSISPADRRSDGARQSHPGADAQVFVAGEKVLLKLKGRPQQKGPAQKLRPERAGPFTITEILSPVSTRLDMSPANWHGLDIFHNS